MKKMMTTLALAAFAISSSQAGVNNHAAKMRNDNPTHPKTVSFSEQSTTTDSKSEETQALTYKTVGQSLLNSSIFTFFQPTNPIALDPTSGLMAIVMPSLSASGGKLSMLLSTNNGTSWNPRVLIPDNQDRIVLMPQIAISNPDGSNELKDMAVVAYGVNYDNNGQGGYGIAESGTVALLLGEEDPIVDEMAKPTTNNPGGGYSYSFGRMTAFEGANSGIIWSGTLNANESVQDGQHGVWVYSNEEGDFSIKAIPTKWSPVKDIFYIPNTATLESNFSSGMVTVSDPDGNLYSWIMNVFADDPEFGNRKPAFSKSTDGGKTWSEFNKLPVELYDTYATEHGGTNGSFRYQYSQLGAVATGNDQTSFFFVLAVDDGQVYVTYDLVEAFYDKGNWSIRKVTTLNGNLTEHPFYAPATANYWDELSKERGSVWANYDESSLGFEIQAARTPDGSDVIVKWVNNNFNRKFTLANPVLNAAHSEQQADNTIITVNDTISGGYYTDVYFTTKPSSSSAWGNVYNATDDDRYDKGTKIPPVVASLNRVPLLNMHTVTTGTNDLFATFPTQLRGTIVSASQDIKYANVNLVNSSVNDNTEEVNANFTLRAPTPNPASDMFSFSYSTSKSGNVQVVMRDALGRLVSTIHDGYLASGIYANNVNTANFNAGVYYVTVTLDGKSLTKAVTIVR